MAFETDLPALISAIYDAGLEFSLWSDALTRIAAAFGLPSANMARQGVTPSECWGFSVGLDPAITQSYVDYYHGINPIWQRSASAADGTVQTDSMVVPRRELVRTEFFNDFLLPQQTEALLSAVVMVEENRQTVVSIHGTRAFDDADVARYKLLVPHMQRAIRMNVKLQQAELRTAAAIEALSHTGEGVVFVNLAGKIIFANAAAEMHFTSGDLRTVNGYLTCNSLTETSALQAAISNCGGVQLKEAALNINVTRKRGGVPLSLLICPVAFDKSRSLASHPLAIILIAKSEAAEKTNLLQLREDYSLTAAEARFAIEIIAGDGIQAAADRLSISKATARTHLSRIFHKTGTRRQAELVRMLISRSKIR